DATESRLLTDTVRGVMTGAAGGCADPALAGLGWAELLAERPRVAIPLVFRSLGETGAHASVLLDVLRAADPTLPAEVALPFAGGRWVVWECATGAPPSEAAARSGAARAETVGQAVQAPPAFPLDAGLPLRPLALGSVEGGRRAELSGRATAAGRRALGWWLLGTGHAMLALARAHAVERVQFGRPLASFQAVRHRLAETLV